MWSDPQPEISYLTSRFESKSFDITFVKSWIVAGEKNSSEMKKPAPYSQMKLFASLASLRLAFPWS
jgi:hypothetical protein